MTYFIADLHFDDEDIRRYENRPFADVTQMNETMIANWNRVVGEEEEVFVLGDVGAPEYVSRLSGHKYLVRGNHDTLSEAEYLAAGFEKVYDLPVIWKNYWMLSHEPLYVNRNMPYANLFGHIHNNPSYRTVSSRSHCVSVERIDYTPVSIDSIHTKVLEATAQEDVVQ